jgi:hypothetical protein
MKKHAHCEVGRCALSLLYAVGGWGNTPVGRPEGAPCPYHNTAKQGSACSPVLSSLAFQRRSALTFPITRATID